LNQALSAAISPVQKSFVQLELGRVLFKSGDEEGARRIYSEILGLSIDLTDEYGIPFALFAADPLSLMKGEFNPILDRLEALMERNRLLPSPALYLIRDITVQIQDKTQESNHLERIKILREAIANSLEDIESIQSLKPLVGSWILRRNSSEQVGDSLIWEAYGDMPLIVGINEESENQSPVLLAFDGPKILSTVIEEAGLDGTFPGSCRVITDPNGGGIRPGGPFRGFWLRFDEMKVSDWSQSSLPFPIFYWLILFLVVGFTTFGGYLIWRDVSRELAIADMRSHFAASVSHELKTPLTAIRMFAEALTMGVHKRPEVQQEYLQTIVSESERLSRLLNNVLDFSKIEQGTRTYRFEPASLEEIVHAAERALAFHLDQKGFKLRIELDENIPPVKADRDALEQAVLNLLHNAMKYSGESRDIFLKLRREGDTARIDVIDFGIGISDVNRSHIFGKFFRVTGIENQRIPGTGLGLTIVSHIAKSHGGRIDVDSRPGEGSTFSIVLPLEAK
jgi:signal transduction histidine kinase